MLDGFRWLTVGPAGQPDLAIPARLPAPPMFSPEDAATRSGRWWPRARSAAASSRPTTAGATSRSSTSKGVTFLQEPAERPYGVEALFRDDSGNWFSLTQSKWDAAQWEQPTT